jgi:hypothetical protein
MKAIITKYHPATSFFGSRISASDCDGNRVYIAYPHHLSGETCYRAAGCAFMQKFGWKGNLVGGEIKGGYAFCIDESTAVEYCGFL